jgi:ankyrin repeat protein
MEPALLNNRFYTLRSLLQQGDDPNSKTKDGVSMLSLATAMRNTKMVQLLLEYGADANIGGPIWTASYGGDPENVYLLLLYGANSNIKDIKGNTPLHMACKMIEADGNYLETVRTLLTYHNSDHQIIEVNPKNRKGDIPLRFAIENQNLPIIDLLLSFGADVHHINERGVSILMVAVTTNNIEIVDLLLRYGADLNELDPEMEAIEADRDMANFGGDLHPHDTFALPLEIAVAHGFSEMTKYLIEHGADPFYTDAFDTTLLYFVYGQDEGDDSNYADTLTYLLNYRDPNGRKLDINVINKYDETPLDVAIRANRPDLVQILLDYGAEVDFDLLSPEMSPEMKDVFDEYRRGPSIKDPGIE